MSDWRPIETAPLGVPIWVAYHGHSANHAQIVTRVASRGQFGDFDYINSHDGDPKYWMPLIVPEAPTDMEGPDCGCDGCLYRYHELEDEAIAAAARERGDGTAPSEGPQSGAESASPDPHTDNHP